MTKVFIKFFQIITERHEKLLLDNLFFLGQLTSLTGLLWGAWLVLREFLIETVCLGRKSGGQIVSFASCLLQPFRWMVRA